ncbi:nmrA-like family domain-containing protein 1 [Lingula anatina]|uniref:NmrA-like family domain-containing protein 1 n=1 Tax=Lingula anatina TaxID=7574 RepID=A0A1S3K5V0_LINAN|nr:nmrA-like family domain-containing protein 1 [Lingula anatina]|eukprot:XP_013418013.1 nmrA-like family domain-containing protein 1 [Lingula anatina]
MADKSARIVVVFGATGTQGGPVAKALAGDPQYKVRAVTRNPGSAKGKALSQIGCEVVKADIDDVASLKSALSGAYGCFAVTNWWEYFDKEKEIQQGKNIADACADCGVKHLVFSSLDAAEKLKGISVAHFDGKAAIEEYMKAKGIPHTVVRYAFYAENLFGIMKPQKTQDGNFALGIPMGDVPMHMIVCADAGECIHQLFNNPREWTGKSLGLASWIYTIDQYCDMFSKILGVTVVNPKMTAEQMAGFGFPGANDLANMFRFYQCGIDRNPEECKRLNPKMATLEQWVTANKEALLKAWNA